MELTLQWLAGFVDGEGCITLYGRHKNPRLIVTNTYLPILKAIQAQYGGSVHSTGAKTPRKCFVIAWQCKQAIALLKQLTPFLMVKKAQADLAIMGYETYKRDGRKLSDDILTKRAQVQFQLTELKNETYIQ